MKRFRFPLHPVAVLRAHREARAQEVFAAAVQAHAKAEQNLAATRQRVAQFEATLVASRRERFSAGNEGQTLTAYRRECVAEAQTERAMVTARNLMHQRRLEYVEAHRKVEVVARFEAKAWAAHRFAANRQEQAEFDDFAGRRASKHSLLPL